VHLDGYNQLPYLTGQQPKSARDEFFYFDDDGNLVATALRRLEGSSSANSANPASMIDLGKSRSPACACRRCSTCGWIPTSGRMWSPISGYDQWRTENVYLTELATTKAAEFLQTFVDYPPSQKPASFSVDQVRAAGRQGELKRRCRSSRRSSARAIRNRPVGAPGVPVVARPPVSAAYR
jgi:hypothetical protein